jgi:hypothetical protein
MDEKEAVIDEIVSKKEAVTENNIVSIEDTIENWFQKHFHGVLGLETELYNQFHSAKEELKTIMKGV